MISMRSKYALKALTVMASIKDKKMFLIADIAEEGNIPKKFLEAILLTLRSQGILNSRKGPGGGYSLAKEPNSITIGNIVRAFEGDLAPVPCLTDTSSNACPECADKATCGTRLIMGDVYVAITSILDSVTLADMLQRSEFERQKLTQQLDFSI